MNKYFRDFCRCMYTFGQYKYCNNLNPLIWEVKDLCVSLFTRNIYACIWLPLPLENALELLLISEILVPPLSG
jgi:hypothetical protein